MCAYVCVRQSACPIECTGCVLRVFCLPVAVVLASSKGTRDALFLKWFTSKDSLSSISRGFLSIYLHWLKEHTMGYLFTDTKQKCRNTCIFVSLVYSSIYAVYS